MSQVTRYDAMAAAKLRSMGESSASAVEDIKKRLRHAELAKDDVLPIAELLASNNQFHTVDKLAEAGLIEPHVSDNLRSTYFHLSRAAWQLFDDAFFSSLTNTKLDSRAIEQVKIASYFLKTGFKEASLVCLLRVVEGVLTDLCLQSLQKLEQHKAVLESPPNNLTVAQHDIESEWGLYAKSLALKEIGVLDDFMCRQVQEDLVDPRNKMFHSYGGLLETEMEILIRQIVALLPSLGRLVAAPTVANSK